MKSQKELKKKKKKEEEKIEVYDSETKKASTERFLDLSLSKNLIISKNLYDNFLKQIVP